MRWGLQAPRLLHRDAARRQVRPDQRGLVVFTLVITDFGIAKVIGGNFNVLATDVYKQVIGQQNFSMGAVVGMMLLAPAALAFVVDRVVQRKQVALLTARAVPLIPRRSLAVTCSSRSSAARLGRHPRHPRHGHLGIADQVLGRTISASPWETMPSPTSTPAAGVPTSTRCRWPRARRCSAPS